MSILKTAMHYKKAFSISNLTSAISRGVGNTARRSALGAILGGTGAGITSERGDELNSILRGALLGAGIGSIRPMANKLAPEGLARSLMTVTPTTLLGGGLLGMVRGGREGVIPEQMQSFVEQLKEDAGLYGSTKDVPKVVATTLKDRPKKTELRDTLINRREDSLF